ncbi:cytidylate kinase [Setomelanomma holmii]|uniref:5'-deoxynucleotidase n=1 Tax=Setomelanomma holmii TaxID=210430 RepID=A0A9P4H8C4_9PLEO|nr:cytidylate kinase [Setomelanomma holmii]
MDEGYFFLEVIETLKHTQRRGWVLRNVPDPESVSDHMYRMAIMCLMVPKIDAEVRMKAVIMCLLHDMGEAIIGDITPSDGVTPESKYLQEEMAMKYLACTLHDSSTNLREMLVDVWHEYEAGQSQAAQLVKQVDKLECIQQAIVYRQKHSIPRLDEFMELQAKITLPELQPLLQVCLKRYEVVKMSQQDDMVIVFVSGGPGVGKGTQCTRLAREYGFHHVCVGDLLRDEARDQGSPYKDFIAESIQKSILLPASFTTELLRKELGRSKAQGQRRFLLDGFPRSINQLTDFESKICSKFCTLSFDCTEQDMRDRLQLRSRSSERIDDNEESVTLRLRTFNDNNAEVLKYLEGRGPLHRIPCRGSIEEVYSLTRSMMEKLTV